MNRSESYAFRKNIFFPCRFKKTQEPAQTKTAKETPHQQYKGYSVSQAKEDADIPKALATKVSKQSSQYPKYPMINTQNRATSDKNTKLLREAKDYMQANNFPEFQTLLQTDGYSLCYLDPENESLLYLAVVMGKIDFIEAILPYCNVSLIKKNYKVAKSMKVDKVFITLLENALPQEIKEKVNREISSLTPTDDTDNLASLASLPVLQSYEPAPPDEDTVLFLKAFNLIHSNDLEGLQELLETDGFSICHLTDDENKTLLMHAVFSRNNDFVKAILPYSDIKDIKYVYGLTSNKEILTTLKAALPY